MVRVTDVDASLKFYCDALGLAVIKRTDYPQGKFTLIFLAAPGDSEAQVELTHNWAPEAYAGGTIALVEEGDSITIDAHRLLIQLEVDDAEIARRRARWVAPKPRYTRGVLGKFARNASTASRGAVLDGD